MAFLDRKKKKKSNLASIFFFNQGKTKVEKDCLKKLEKSALFNLTIAS